MPVPPLSSQSDDDAAVRHLVELGYVDPELLAAREAVLRDHQQTELAAATRLHNQGRLQEAVAILDGLVRDDPDWVTPHTWLAEIHFQAGRWNDAQRELDWLTHHGVEHPRLAMMSAAIALAKRDLPTALELLEYACYAEPALAGVQTLYAIVLLRQKKLDAAEAAFQAALRQNPEDARALDGLAAVCLQRGDFAAAADWALRALEHNMQRSQAHYHLGLALAALARPRDALAALEAFARLEPARAAPYYWLARIAERELGDVAQAENYRARGRQIVRHRRAPPPHSA